MIKVYEALQNVEAERNLVAQIRNHPAGEKPTPSRTENQDYPARRMQREIVRLHQGLTALLLQSPKPIIQFIGAREGEGTSTIVWEYGGVMAEKMNKSILIVDGDRSATKHSQSGTIQATISLHELLRDEQYQNGSIPKVKDPGLYLCVLTNTDQAKYQNDSLGKDEKNWANLRAQFDCILIDSPPISFSDDALAWCSLVDGVVLVVEAESTRSPIVHHLRERIIQHGGHILGVIFNKQRYYIPEWIYKKF